MLSVRKSSAFLAVCAALGISHAAQAQFIVTAQPIGSGSGLGIAATTLYSDIPGPYVAFAPASGVLGFDDYTTVAGTPTFLPDTLRFAGGVSSTAAGRTIGFEFYNPNGTFANGFNVTFGQTGNFVYTINGLSAIGPLPSAGFLQLRAAAGTNGQWFLTTTAPTVGTNDPTVGGNAGPPVRNFVFELNGTPIAPVPEPGTIALMLGMTSMGGMLALRRRRK